MLFNFSIPHQPSVLFEIFRDYHLSLQIQDFCLWKLSIRVIEQFDKHNLGNNDKGENK